MDERDHPAEASRGLPEAGKGALWALAAMFVGLGGLVLAGSWPPSIETTPLAVVFVLSGLLCWQMSRSRITLSADGIEIVNVLRKHHVPWDEFAGFEERTWFRLTPDGWVKRQSEPALWVFALSFGLGANRSLTRTLEELSDVANRYTSRRR